MYDSPDRYNETDSLVGIGQHNYHSVFLGRQVWTHTEGNCRNHLDERHAARVLSLRDGLTRINAFFTRAASDHLEVFTALTLHRVEFMQGTYLFFQVTINTFVKMTTTVSSDKSDTLTVRRTFVLTCDEKFVTSKLIDTLDTYNAERLWAIDNRALCEKTTMSGNQ